jgi:ribosomal protein L11 methyltransferase
MMLELFPEGFEEADGPDGVELAAYTDAAGEERLWKAFGGASGADVESGWEDRWRDFHRPVRVGSLWIGPPWEEPAAGAIGIVIDPGRAFGTGAHPTTRLCLELLLDAPRGSLLDVGCGSGVLAIAAAKLGFAPILAIDIDEVAIQATSANARENGVELETQLADALAASSLPAADVAVANITLAGVERVAPRLDCARFVTSGYLASERPRIEGYEAVRRAEADGWAADLSLRQPG